MDVRRWGRLLRVKRELKRGWAHPTLRWPNKPKTAGPGWRRNRDLAERSWVGVAAPALQASFIADNADAALETRLARGLRRKGVLLDWSEASGYIRDYANDGDGSVVVIALWSRAAAQSATFDAAALAPAAAGRLLFLRADPDAPPTPPRYQRFASVELADEIGLERELLRRGVVFYPAAIMASGAKRRIAPDIAPDADRALDFLMQEARDGASWVDFRTVGLRYPGSRAAADAVRARRWLWAEDLVVVGGAAAIGVLLLVGLVLGHAWLLIWALLAAPLLALLMGFLDEIGSERLRRRLRARMAATPRWRGGAAPSKEAAEAMRVRGERRGDDSGPGAGWAGR